VYVLSKVFFEAKCASAVRPFASVSVTPVLEMEVAKYGEPLNIMTHFKCTVADYRWFTV